MPSPNSIESRLYDHVLGASTPHPMLVNTSVLTDDWTEMYLLLLTEAVQKFEGQDSLPREVVAAVHFASWYLNIRYDLWRGFNNGQRNEKTERNLGRLRTPSEFLLLSGGVEKAKHSTLANEPRWS